MAKNKKDLKDINDGSIDIKIELERLKAKVEALGKAREVLNERFANFSERLGELRSMFVDHERYAKDLEVRMKKAIEIVESTKPQEILVEFKKQDAKIEAVRAKIDSTDVMLNRLTDDMKKMHQTLLRFKGVDEALKVWNDVRKEAQIMKKLESEVKKRADKVETIFIEVEKRINKFEELNERVKQISEAFKEMVREFNELRVSNAKKATKEEFERFKREGESKLEEIQQLKEEVEAQKREVKKLLNSSKDIIGASDRIEKKLKEIDILKNEFDVIHELIKSYENLSNKANTLEQSLKSVKEEIKAFVPREEVEQLKKDLSAATKAVEQNLSNFENETIKKIRACENFKKRVEKLEKELNRFRKQKDEIEKMHQKMIKSLKKILKIVDTLDK